MSRRTFYLAASSSNVEQATAAMNELGAMGYEVAFPWPNYLSAPARRYPSLAAMDLESARDCGVFVVIANPPSYGAMGEMCARLSHGKAAHVVGPAWHFFHAHPLVVMHEDWSAFLAALARGDA